MSDTKSIESETPAAVAGAAPCSAITLTCAEIVDLVKFCGLRLMEEPDDEEKQTEITIQTWPEKGVMDDDGVTKLPPHKYIAYYEDLQEEGCIPLGSPNSEVSSGAKTP